MSLALPGELRALLGKAPKRAARGPLSRRLLTSGARRRLAGLGEASFVLASDENALGGCAEMAKTGLLYPTAKERLSLWRALADNRDATIFLSLRGYAGFFSAVHGQTARAGAYEPLARGAHELMKSPPRRWTDLVADIRAALPNAHLALWAFEDYPALRRTVLARLTRREDVEPVRRTPMATPSVAAMARIAEGGAPDAAAARAIIADNPVDEDNPRYTAFSAAEALHLEGLYAEDLMRLRDDPDIEFLSA